jgi:hypothetical protein
MKLDLLTNATVVDDAVRFVSDKSKDNLGSSDNIDTDQTEKEESNQPDYNEDKDQLEGEQQEEEAEEMTSSTTINQIF